MNRFLGWFALAVVVAFLMAPGVGPSIGFGTSFNVHKIFAG